MTHLIVVAGTTVTGVNTNLRTIETEVEGLRVDVQVQMAQVEGIA